MNTPRISDPDLMDVMDLIILDKEGGVLESSQSVVLNALACLLSFVDFVLASSVLRAARTGTGARDGEAGKNADVREAATNRLNDITFIVRCCLSQRSK